MIPKTSISVLLHLATSLGAIAAKPPIWPARTDFLEGLLYEQFSRDDNAVLSPATAVVPCDALDFGKGRSIAAEWIRTAFHDVATHDAAAGTGGIDASIGFELDRPENPGLPQFRETLLILLPFLTSRSSLADLIAMGALMSAGACSDRKLDFPYRGGRVDATGPGPKGVPEPQDDTDSLVAAFKRQGFTKKEMIGLVACGHTLGGVHGEDFPEIVPVPANDTSDGHHTQSFDKTFEVFDNSVASGYVANDQQNPLAFGPEKTRSDERVFNCDGKREIKRLASSNDKFLKTCSSLFEKMVNTVPKRVTLSDPITALPVKPSNLFATINTDGTMTVSGSIRLIDIKSPNPGRSVKVIFRNRKSDKCNGPKSCPEVDAIEDPDSWKTSASGPASKYPVFKTYNFTTTVPISDGLSSFVVKVTDKHQAASKTVTHTNNGQGYPFQDTLLVQRSLSCSDEKGLLNVTVAVRDDAKFTQVSGDVEVPEPLDALVPQIKSKPITFTKIGRIPGSRYTLYNSQSNHDAAFFNKIYNFVGTGAKTVERSFNMANELPACS